MKMNILIGSMALCLGSSMSIPAKADANQAPAAAAPASATKNMCSFAHGVSPASSLGASVVIGFGCGKTMKEAQDKALAQCASAETDVVVQCEVAPAAYRNCIYLDVGKGADEKGTIYPTWVRSDTPEKVVQAVKDWFNAGEIKITNNIFVEKPIGGCAKDNPPDQKLSN
jgi:hypothetical protein